VDNLSNFAERLKELLFDNNLSPEQLAKAIDAERNTVYGWVSEPTKIRVSHIIALADYFRCTIEFLIGRSDCPGNVVPKQLPDFASQVRRITSERGLQHTPCRKQPNLAVRMCAVGKKEKCRHCKRCLN